MKLYLNELAPWERKSEYYRAVRLGENISTQNELIHQGFESMIEAQLASANAIVASQELGFSKVVTSINQVSQGIEGLKSAFEFGISEVVWQIEQNREELKDILHLLSAPLDTQARELRRRAEEAYRNGWIDDALGDFHESEVKNKYDFSIHISLGIIYLFHEIDKKKAITYFEKAIKYSRPKSNYHTSFSLLHKALIHRSFGELVEAEDCAQEAVNLSPNFAEAIYQYAGFRALNGKDINILSEAIKIDPKYILKACSDDIFKNYRSQLDEMSQVFRAQSKKDFLKFENIINDKINSILELLVKAEKNLTPLLIKSIKNEFKEIDKIFNEVKKINSFLDFYYFDKNKIVSKINSITEKIKKHLLVVKESSKKERDIVYSDRNKKRDLDIFSILWIFIAFFGTIIAFVVGFFSRNTGEAGSGIMVLTFLGTATFFIIGKFRYSRLGQETSEEKILKMATSEASALLSDIALKTFSLNKKDDSSASQIKPLKKIPTHEDHYIICERCGCEYLSQYPHKCKI